MRRREGRVVDAAHDDRYGVVEQTGRQFLGDVVRAQRVLEADVELVIGADHFSALADVVAGQVAALAVNIQRNVLTQLFDVIFATAGRHAIGHEPGGQFLLARNVGRQIFPANRRIAPTGVRVHGRQLAPTGYCDSVGITMDNVRIETIRHRPVEEAKTGPLEQQRFRVRVGRRLHFVKDESLMRKPVSRQIDQVQILDGENDDVALVEKRSVVRDVTARRRTLGVDKRLMTETEREILDAEETIPVQNRF